MKKILVTGKGSYIGTSVEEYLGKYPETYTVNTVDTKEDDWKKKNFSEYDVVFHVAGIAHVSTNPKMKDLYYKVNTELTFEVAKKAKAEGVKQFIFMSSIIVYGDSIGGLGVICRNTVPKPSNFYGDSKLQAENVLKKLENDEFKVVILRPPMIYGKGSKGNYPLLSKFAKKLPIFPDIDNQRSMLHIDNLCEFIKLMIDNEETGIFFPQNKEYVKTSDMVRAISKITDKKIKLTKVFNPILRLMFGFSIVNKAFGNLVYEKSMSEYQKGDYQVRDFVESIKVTESEINNPKRILLLANHDIVIYNFRKELIERLLHDGYKVIISSPYGERIDYLIEMGCEYIEATFDRHGTNVFNELKLLRYYEKLMREIKPDVVLTYTIKPNIYGGLAAKKYNVPYIANITGLGTAVENKGLLRYITVVLYKLAFSGVSRIFFQNTENMKFFIEKNIKINKHKLLPGSGVNLSEFTHERDKLNNGRMSFLFIGRLMKDKGIEEYLEVANNITMKYSNVEFLILGAFEEERYKSIIKNNKNERIKYLGVSNDVRREISKADCIVNPSYHEGMSNVLLEGAAMGKPLIASNIPGCKEIVENGKNGFLFDVKSIKDMEDRIIQFLNLSNKQRLQMGEYSRRKVEKEFDRKIVINEYIKDIESILK